MTMMQAHLRTISTNELEEFKRQITPNATQTLITALRNMKTATNPLSRETSPHADQTITEFPPSRETGPHHAKSTKKLAQALKKCVKHEVEQRTDAPKLDRSFEMLAQALKPSTRISCPDSSMKRLVDTLRQHSRQKRQCKECGGEHPIHVCAKRFERLRRPQTIPLFMSDDSSTNDSAPHNPERTTDSNADLLIDLEKAMTKLSI